MRFNRVKRATVGQSGAAAGSVLFGVSPGNTGLRLRVLEPQGKDGMGPILGRFVILDAGDNKHTDSLFDLLQRETDAAEVLGVIRQAVPGCISVVNVNVLGVEERP